MAEALEGRRLLAADYLLTTLASFNGANGADPTAGLTMDAAGNLYGTTQFGGANGDGTVFEIASGTGVLTTLASFNGINGAVPVGGVTLDSAGNLYGTTKNGGSSADGTVFEIAVGSGTLTALASFNGANGANPLAGLTLDSAGNLYGTTYSGGNSRDGTVFEIAAGSGVITTLATFNGANGANPSAGLTLDAAGNLYGTTEFGGSAAFGTVFEIPVGSNTVTTLASFGGANGSLPDAAVTLDSAGNLYGTTNVGGGVGGGFGTIFEIPAASGVMTTLARFDVANGADPQAALTLGSDGNLYGTTEISDSSRGTVFEIDKQTAAISTILTFNGRNGAFPLAGLTIDANGDLLGTTSASATGSGTVFELSPTAAPVAAPISGPDTAVPFQTLPFNFSATSYGPGYQYEIDWGDGSELQTIAAPQISVGGINLNHFFTSPGSYNVSLTVLDKDGLSSQTVTDPITVTQALTLPGGTSASIQSTLQDIANNVQQSSAGGSTQPIQVQVSDQTTLDNLLAAISALGVNTGVPTVDITVDASNSTYQTSQVSVPPNVTLTLNGTTFVGSYRMTSGPGYVLTTLFSFTNFENPTSGPILDSAGNVYGTTAGGGTYDNGTIFKLSAGTLTTLASISEPASSYGGLTLDAAGNLYGTIEGGGDDGDGAVFEVAANSGVFTILASFDGTNGSYPESGLTLDSAGNLYGTTSSGGDYGDGTVFEIATGSGVVTTLDSFNGANGDNPNGGLTLDSNGNLYGTTVGGGSLGYGTVFEIPAGGHTVTTLASFNGYDGANPFGAVTLDSAGNLYGTTASGITTGGSGQDDGEDNQPVGNTGLGSVFEIAAGTGVITTLASFDGTDGATPTSGLTRDPAGNLYGMTNSGGMYGNGTVFEIANGSGTITTLASFSDPSGGSTSLARDAAGDLFGTRALGGTGSGIVFELIPTTPAAAISGPQTGVQYQTLALTFSATDALPATDAAGYQYQIDWGDGSGLQTIAAVPGNGDGINLGHVYTAPGSYNVSVTVLDSDGVTSQPVVYPVQITQDLSLSGGTSGSIQSTLQD
ncbi:MAG TPA: choice-of-anchor tandem repeat GloVer-containing protein, partial [Tepidisphaeraceae bacterium]|nr:choice-of-anchor tandem repeat GloVer-containing protein [Tepidisphaeraceae bacterium]